MSTFRTAVVSAPGRIDTVERELPDLGPLDVEIEVTACGICGTNLHHLANPLAIPEPKRSCAGALGHEAIGRIASRGDSVAHLDLGDVVAFEPQLAAACGACKPCRAGAPWFCERPAPLRTWAFGERMVIDAAGAWPLPDGLDHGVATLIEPLAVAVHALRLSARAAHSGGSLDGARVAVIGAGVTGLLAVAAAQHLGAGDVIALARYAHQVDRANALGATDVEIDGAAAERRLRVFRPDVVVECVGGSAETFELAVRVVAPMGEVSVVGIFDATQTIDTARAFRNETRISFPVAYSALNGTHDFAVASDILVRREAELAPLITHRHSLASIAEAFADAADKRSGALRVVVQPSDGAARR